MGHTRAATVASGGTKNAHPFHFETEDGKDSLILTHNGHINNAWMLNNNKFSHGVDSAQVAWALFNREPGKEQYEMLKELKGFYVLIWYNQRGHTLHMCRNDHRALAMVYNKNKTQMFYASESPMLQFLADRAKISWEGEVEELDPFTLYTWDLSDKTLAKPKKEKYEEKKFPPLPIYGAGSGSSTTHGGGNRTWPPANAQIDPINPMRGDTIHIALEADNFEPYKNANGSPGRGDYGIMVGTRRMDKDSIAEVGGIKKADWDAKWHKIRDALPAYIVAQPEIVKGTPTKYKCTIDKDLAQKEYNKLHPQLPVIPNTCDFNYDEDYVPGPEKDVLISLGEFMAMGAEGCFMCRGKILESDAGKVAWYAHPVSPEDKPTDVEYQQICPTCRKELQEAPHSIIGLPEIIPVLEGFIPSGEMN